MILPAVWTIMGLLRSDLVAEPNQTVTVQRTDSMAAEAALVADSTFSADKGKTTSAGPFCTVEPI